MSNFTATSGSAPSESEGQVSALRSGDLFGLMETAFKLTEIHRLQKWLYGSQWPSMVAETEPVLRTLATRDNCSTTAAAVRWAKETKDPKLSLLLLAVAVEIK